VGLTGLDVSVSGGDSRLLAILPAPADPTTGPFTGFSPGIPVISSGLNVADFYVDVDVAGDGVLVSFTAN
jgi:hypothetical protein